jgi:hypothetical protein
MSIVSEVSKPITTNNHLTYPPLRHLRQQAPHVLVPCFLPSICIVDDLCGNRIGLPQPDKNAIEGHPLMVNLFSDGLSDVGGWTAITGKVDCNLLEIAMFVREGLECHSNPHVVGFFEPEYHLSQSRRFRKVNRTNPWIVYCRRKCKPLPAPQEKPKRWKLPMGSHLISTRSRVSEHSSTNAVMHRRSSSMYLLHSSSRKRMRFGSSNNRWVMVFIPRVKESLRAPVNGGEVDGWEVGFSSSLFTNP